MTPAARQCRETVETLFPFITHVGVYKRRRIAGTSSWSQHSWANALDLHVATRQEGDLVHRFLEDNREAFGIRVLLWWVRDHYDHLHVDFWPKGEGTPPLTQRGYGWFLYPGGPKVRRKIREVPAHGQGVEVSTGLRRGDSGHAVRFYQEAINAWGGTQPLTVDGQFGPLTEAGVVAYQRAADLAETGVIGSPEDFLIGRYHPSFD